MKTVLWLSDINEIDEEIQKMFAGLPGWRFVLAQIDSRVGFEFSFDVRIDYRDAKTTEAIAAIIEREKPDILVNRSYISPDILLPAAIERNVRTAVFVTEQGPLRDYEIVRSADYHHVIVTNRRDCDYYRAQRIENVIYVPLGYWNGYYRPVASDERYRTELVCYGHPRWKYLKSRRHCLETIVRPFIENGSDVAVWGLDRHFQGGWLELPWMDAARYRGVFPPAELPSVIGGSKIVLGLNSNAEFGAFGTRLIRVLACRGFLLWYYSEGMEEEFENHRHLCWASEPSEALEIASYYLANEEKRARVAEEGFRIASARYEYTRTLVPELERLLAEPPANASAYFAFRTRLEGLISSADLDGARRLMAAGESSHAGSVREYAIRFYAGVIAYLDGRPEDAMREFLAAARDEIRSSRFECRNNLAVLFAEAGNIAEARRCLDEVIVAVPEYRDAVANRSALEKGGKLRLTVRLARTYFYAAAR